MDSFFSKGIGAKRNVDSLVRDLNNSSYNCRYLKHCLTLFLVYSCTQVGDPRSLLTNVLDFNIVVIEFKLKSRYFVHFRTNNLGNGMEPFILPAMG